MVECACPWCHKPAEKGQTAMFSDLPTCREHGWEQLLEDLKQQFDKLGKKES